MAGGRACVGAGVPAASGAVARLPHPAKAHPSREDPALGMAQAVPLAASTVVSLALLPGIPAMSPRLEAW